MLTQAPGDACSDAIYEPPTGTFSYLFQDMSDGLFKSDRDYVMPHLGYSPPGNYTLCVRDNGVWYHQSYGDDSCSNLLIYRMTYSSNDPRFDSLASQLP